MQGRFDPNRIRADSVRFGAYLRLKSRSVLEEWLEAAFSA
jgi:hypothetical protein